MINFILNIISCRGTPVNRTKYIFHQIPLLESFVGYLSHKTDQTVSVVARIESIDAVLEKIKSKRNLVNLRRRLQVEKITEWLKGNNYEAVNEVLSLEKERKIHAWLIGLLIDKAASQNRQDPPAFLREAFNRLDHFQLRILLGAYADYLVRVKNRDITFREEIETIDQLLIQAQPKEDFPKLHLILRFRKLTACLDADDDVRTRAILDQENRDSKMHAISAVHWIKKAEHFYQQGQHDEARAYLTAKCNSLDGSLKYKTLLEKYRTHIACCVNSNVFLEEQIQKIDEALGEMEPRGDFVEVRLRLQYKKLCLYLDGGRNRDVKSVLDQIGENKEVDSLLASLLIKKSNSLDEESPGSSPDYLSKVCSDLQGSLKYRPLIEAYIHHVLSQRNLNPSDDGRIRAIDQVLERAKPEDDFSEIRLQLQHDKAIYYVNTDQDIKAEEILTKESADSVVHRRVADHLIKRADELLQQGHPGEVFLASKCGTLKLIKYRGLIEKYGAYISCCKNKKSSLEERTKTIDAVLNELILETDFAELCTRLEEEKLLVRRTEARNLELRAQSLQEKLLASVAANNFDEANKILQEKDLLPETGKTLVSYLIGKAEALCNEGKHVEARGYLNVKRVGLGESLKYRTLIEKYENYIFKITEINLDKESEINQAIELIDRLLYEFEKAKLPVEQLIKKKTAFLYHLANIHYLKNNFPAAAAAAKKGRALIPKNGHNPHAKIDYLLEKWGINE